MNNKLFGILLIIASMILLVVVFSYTIKIIELQMLLHTNCPLPPEVCPARQIPLESVVGVSFVGFFFILGIYNLVLSRKKLKITKQTNEKNKQKIKNLTIEQKKIYDIISESGAIFQSELVEKSEIGKVKVTRILDKLEGFGLIERKRRGMSNMIILKG